MKRLLHTIGLGLLVLVVAPVALAADSDEHMTLFGPVWNEDIPRFKAVLKSGIDVNTTGERGQTILHKAVSFKNNPALVKMLLNAGANTNIKFHGVKFHDVTALELARDIGRTELVELMVQNRVAQGATVTWAATAYDLETGDYGVGWGFPTKKAAQEAVIEKCISKGGRGGGVDSCLSDVRSRETRCVVFSKYTQLYVGGTSERLFVAQFGDTQEEALRRLREGTDWSNECSVCEVLVARCAD